MAWSDTSRRSSMSSGLRPSGITRGPTPGSISLPAVDAPEQAWRASPGQHRLHLLLGDELCDVVALDRDEALRVGAMCARTGAVDVVDVSVACCAARRGHAVVTSGADGIAAVDPSLRLIVL